MIFEPVGLGFSKDDFSKDEEIALNNGNCSFAPEYLMRVRFGQYVSPS